MGKEPLAGHYLSTAAAAFRQQKSLGESAIAQLHDPELHVAPAGSMNTVAILMKHLAGNMRSRFTRFLTEDGEKDWRRRDEEFMEGRESRKELLSIWDEGWTTVLEAVDSLDDGDLLRTVHVRGEPHSALEAIQRQVGHYSYHVGQMVCLARQLAGERWESLSIPPGESDRHNESMGFRPGNGP